MGRPLRKDVKGTDAIGSFTGANTGIRVEFHDGSTVQDDGIIVKQRGARTFVVARVGTPLTRFTRVLVNATPAAGQMRLFGWVGGNGGTSVNIAKITKRVATDFTGKKYTWFLENDSSNDYIVLTAL